MVSTTADFELFTTLQLTALQHVPDGLSDQLNELRAPLTAFFSARKAIADDRRLTPDAKFADTAEARATAHATIISWRDRKRAAVDRQIATLESTLVDPSPTPTDAQVQQMISQLADFEALEVIILHADATEAERRVIEAAAAQLGRRPVRRNGQLLWESLLTPEDIEATTRARRDREHPEAARQLAQLRRVRNVYDSVASSALSLL